MGQNLEFLSLFVAALLAYGLKRTIDTVSERGVMTLLTPLFARCHLTSLLRRGVSRNDTPKNRVDTPVDTQPDTYDYDPNGALTVSRNPGSRVRLVSSRDRYAHNELNGHHDDQDQDQDGPPVRDQKATAAVICAWVKAQIDAGWTRAEILAEGQELYAVHESTMVRRYRDVTGVNR